MESSALTDSPDPVLTDRFEKALVFANERHRWQSRKGTRVPYMAHLLAVTAMVLEHGGTEDQAIGALLHDVAEDQEVPIEEIRLRFGEQVAEIVEGCSDGLGRPRDKDDWEQRKQEYLVHLRNEASPATRLVAAADKLHNLRSMVADYQQQGEGFWARLNSTKEQNLRFYGAIVKTLTDLEDSKFLEELSTSFSQFESLVHEKSQLAPDDATAFTLA